MALSVRLPLNLRFPSRHLLTPRAAVKSVLAHFYFGSPDLSDPPRIGLLSTLPPPEIELVDQRYSSLLPTKTLGVAGPVPTGTTSVADPRFTGWKDL